MKKISISLLLIICLVMTGCGEPKTKELITVLQ